MNEAENLETECWVCGRSERLLKALGEELNVCQDGHKRCDSCIKKSFGGMTKKYEECFECHCKLGDEYYSFVDNFLQVKFFQADDGSDNAFCSQRCACNALMLETLENVKEN